MKIHIVEDDYWQLESVSGTLRDFFEDIEIDASSSCLEFLNSISGDSDANADLYLFDLMLPWCRPGEDTEKPPETWTAQNGGMHLAEHLRSANQNEAPIIIWTVLQASQLPEHLPENTMVLSKSATSPTHLVASIRSMMLCRGVDPPLRDSTLKELADSAELKPGMFGISIDLKKVFGAAARSMANKRMESND